MLRDLPSPEEVSKQWHGRGQSSEFARKGTTEAVRWDRREVFKWIVEEALPEAWDRGGEVCKKEKCWKHVDSFNCYEHLEAELRKILDEQGGSDG